MGFHTTKDQPGGISGTAGWFEGLGLRPGRLHAWIAGLKLYGLGWGLAVLIVGVIAGVGTVSGFRRPVTQEESS